ncbi:MAG: hypothetical protein MUF54_18045, partial [Polyangiaceae bacterium]|nr:hypothetical protein [Polyangiaceae bacterium]
TRPSGVRDLIATAACLARLVSPRKRRVGTGYLATRSKQGEHPMRAAIGRLKSGAILLAASSSAGKRLELP